jgi:hypothetical protein
MATARTVTQVIQAALRRIAVLDPGVTVDTNDTTTGLEAFQDLISELASEDMMIPSIAIESFDLVADQASYTIGEDGTPDKSTRRPEDIVGAYIRDSSDYDYPVDIVGEADYRQYRDKSLSGRPDKLWYNPTVPNGTIYLWQVPDTVETLYIQSYKPLTDPAQLSDELEDDTLIPRNYHNYLKYALAVEIAPEYGIAPPAWMVGKSIELKSKIMSKNAGRRVKPVPLEISRVPGGYRRNILTG